MMTDQNNNTNNTQLISNSSQSTSSVLSTDAETALFRAIIKYRPRGLNRHFSMIGICKDLERDLGNSISSDQIWSFLSSCYDLDLLNEMEPDRLDDFDYIQTIRNVTSSSAPSLDRLKYFKEFQLPIHPATPEELSFLKLVDERRLETEVESPRTDHKTSSIGQSDPYESQENLNNVSKDEIKLTFGGDDGMESDLTEPDDFEDEEEEEEEEEEDDDEDEDEEDEDDNNEEEGMNDNEQDDVKKPTTNRPITQESPDDEALFLRSTRSKSASLAKVQGGRRKR